MTNQTPTMPTIVCLCGSTRFGHAFREANLLETLAGRIVLSIGCDMRADHELFTDLDADRVEQIKADLDELHKRKIDLADEVLVLNVGGYIGESTRSEIGYAERHGKRVRYLEPAGTGQPMTATVHPADGTPAELSGETTCNAVYPSAPNPMPNTRIVHCGRPTGHDGDHEEVIDGEPSGCPWQDGAAS